MKEHSLALAVVLAAGCTMPMEVGTTLDGTGACPTGSDAGPADAGKRDAGPADAGKPDAGKPDAGSPDAGSPDAGSPDAGPPDAGGASVSVGAGVDIFSAGQIGGPPAIAVVPGSLQVTFSAPGSGLSCCGTASPHDADGGAGLSSWIRPSPAIGISGIRHYEKNIFLIGVFMDDAGPDPASTPPELSYSTAQNFAGTTCVLDGGETADGGSTVWTWDGAASFAPMLYQTFFIGDGLTGTGAGATQIFSVPSGATKLYLGFADGYNAGDFTHGLGTPSPSAPGDYGDNTGAVTVTYTFQ